MQASCVPEVKDFASFGHILPSVEAHCQHVIDVERGISDSRRIIVVFRIILVEFVSRNTKVTFSTSKLFSTIWTFPPFNNSPVTFC